MSKLLELAKRVDALVALNWREAIAVAAELRDMDSQGEAVVWMCRSRYGAKRPWGEWYDCTAEEHDDIQQRKPVMWESRALYTRPPEDARDAARLDWLDANPRVIIRSGKQHIRPLIDIAMKESK